MHSDEEESGSEHDRANEEGQEAPHSKWDKGDKRVDKKGKDVDQMRD